MKCHHCQLDAVYKCSICEHLLCAEHTRFRTICPKCTGKTRLHFAIKRITFDYKEEIRKFMEKFWGEEEQLTFDHKYCVPELPGYVATLDKKVIGFISTAQTREAVLIVALGVLPEYQNSSVGKTLAKKVESEAKQTKKRSILVSTSNDDLPALAFYQSIGFQIYEVRPNVIAEKHGKIINGIGKLPVRDELRLQKPLRS
jgi:ribosomal protein S18 acetylase RimI-like enzyme